MNPLSKLADLKRKIASIHRFLVHPKKMRNVENDIWIKILNEYQNRKITLYKE